MKKKIIEKLNEGYNREALLLPEIKIRDDLLFNPILLMTRKNFYTLFMESIKELEREKEIVRISNMELELIVNRAEKEAEYPSYPSRFRKTPENYSLKKDNPRIYLGLNAPNVKDHIADLKWQNTAIRSESNRK